MSAQTETTFPWHAHASKDVLQTLASTPRGLREDEVTERRKEHGENALPKKPPRSAFLIFFSQFSSPLIAVLVLAAAASMVLGEWFDASIIATALLLNTCIGFFQEYKADRSLEQLRNILPQEVRVRRASEVHSIPSTQLVPGDIILLSTGDRVSADARILTQHALEMNEAPLTGESRAVEKQSEVLELEVQISDQINMVFAGTVVVAGRGEAVVTQTGSDTQIGRIAALVAGLDDEKTPLQLQLARFARWLGVAVAISSLLVFVIGLARGYEGVEMFKIAIAIAVSAIPEGLIVAMTAILAIGMQRILKKRALVRRLVAAETLGGVSIICMDKTGTLTTGEMAVVDIHGDEPGMKQMILQMSTTTVEQGEDELRYLGSPTEVALSRFIDQQPGDEPASSDSEIPFDSSYKYKAQVRGQGLTVIGAPDVLLDKLNVTDNERQALERTLSEMTDKGLRVLLCARRDDPAGALSHDSIVDLSFVGFVGLKDPLRPEAAQTVAEAKAAGLHPVMITGDHPTTAFEIATSAGVIDHPDRVMTGLELDDLSEDEFRARLDDISVFARVLPRHKLRIIHAWQARGSAVAMVGDGVNDAPAMKGADIGIALGSGTDVAKETADIVLLNNRFKTIIDAIHEGRTIFDNIRKMMVYLLSDSFSEVLLILVALMAGTPLPILPAQILWINLVTDGFASIALTLEPSEKGVMNEPPRPKKEPLLNGEMKALIITIGVVTNVILLSVYFFLLEKNLPIEHVRTVVFFALGLDSLIYVFSIRTFRTSILKSNPLSNRWLLVGIGVGLIFLLMPAFLAPLREAFNFTTLSGLEWLILGGLTILDIIGIEIVKSIYQRRSKNDSAAPSSYAASTL